MKCPFCNEEMEHGFLYTSQMYGFKWLPDGAKTPDFKFKKNGSMLFGSPKFEISELDKLSFWVCKKCMKGVADELTQRKR